MNLVGGTARTRHRWQTDNPVLANGEPGIELDRSLLKIGDGTRTWSQLPVVHLRKNISIVVQSGSGEAPATLDGGSP